MDDIITVIGPVDGRYHLGYRAGTKFFSIHQFVSRELADLTAWRMNTNRQKGIA